MADYSKMTNEEFEAILEEIVREEGVNVLSVPGVAEVLREYFTNEVLDRWASENPEKAWPTEDA